MAIVRTYYGNTVATDALTMTFASLAHDATTLIGRQSAVVNNLPNTTNCDLDALVSGVVRMSAVAPTAGGTFEIWVAAQQSVAASVVTMPDGMGTADAAKTFASLNVKWNAMKLLAQVTVEAVASRDYPISPQSIAALFGGSMPSHWCLWITNATGQALNATQVAFQYQRILGQVL